MVPYPALLGIMECLAWARGGVASVMLFRADCCGQVRLAAVGACRWCGQEVIGT